MTDTEKLLILAIETNTRLRFTEHGFYVFPGESLPEGSVQRLRDAADELAELVEELFAFELSDEDEEEMGRRMLEEHLAAEAAELEAQGICPTCRGTGHAPDSDGIPDEVCTDCPEYIHRSPDDSESLDGPVPIDEPAGEATGIAPVIAGPTSAFADPGVDGAPSPSPEAP